MTGINKVIIIGNVGKAPETRYLASGDAVTNFPVATSDSWKDKTTGEKKEKTEWHRISMFGKIAEIAEKYLKKGSKVYIEGKLQTRKYTGNDGVEKHATSIIAHSMQMLDGKQDDGQNNTQAHNNAPAQNAPVSKTVPANAPASQGAAASQASDDFADFDSDIPF